jgi:hypothetical protein
MSKNRFKKAYASLLRLRGSEIRAAKEIYYIHAQMQQEELMIEQSQVATNANMFTRFVELFKIPRLRRAVQASGIVMIAQQMQVQARKTLQGDTDCLQVRNQHHRLLLVHCLCQRWRKRHWRSSCIMGLRRNQLLIRLARCLDH